MKKIITIIGIITLLVGLTACNRRNNENSSGDSGESKEQRILRVGTEGSYRPFSYHNEEDELVGFDVEVAEAVADKLDVKVEFHEAGWDSMIAAFDAGRTDAVFNQVSITEERQAKYNFTTPYSVAHISIIVGKDNDDIHTFSDLNGKSVAQTITSNFARIAEDNGATIASVETFINSFDLVMSNRADATLNDDVIFYDFLNQQPDTPLKIAVTSDEGVPAAVLLKKEDNELLDEINRALDELKEDGTLTKISEKYFNRDITK